MIIDYSTWVTACHKPDQWNSKSRAGIRICARSHFVKRPQECKKYGFRVQKQHFQNRRIKFRDYDKKHVFYSKHRQTVFFKKKHF